MFEDLRKQISVIQELFKVGFYSGIAAGSSKDYKEGVQFVQATVKAKAEELTGDASGDVRAVRRKKEKQILKQTEHSNKKLNKSKKQME